MKGSCGYGQQIQQVWPFWNVVAISPKNPLITSALPQDACGRCIEIRCNPEQNSVSCENSASLRVQIVDTCPACVPDRLVIPFTVYSQNIGPTSKGQAPIQYRQIDCQPPGNIRIDVDTFRPTKGGYIRLTLKWVAGSGNISSVELRESLTLEEKLPLTPWLPMENLHGGSWEISGITKAPLDMRITGNGDEVLIAREAIGVPAPALYSTSVQFQTENSNNTSTEASQQESAYAGIISTPITSGDGLPQQPRCTDTIMDVLKVLPNTTTTLRILQNSSFNELLSGPSTQDQAITFIAPSNAAWDKLSPSVFQAIQTDEAIRNEVILYLIISSVLSLPGPQDFLPEDTRRGAIKMDFDTLGGYSMGSQTNQQGITMFIDRSPQTGPASVVQSIKVCSSYVYVTDTVLLPFPI